MNRCEKHGPEFWSVNNDWCSRCKWEEERRADREEQSAASRLERVSKMFGELMVENIKPDPRASDRDAQSAMDAVWKWAERIVDFQIKKERGE